MSNEILCYILEFQSRSLIVQSLLQAEAVKEYDADWLPEAKKVMRDSTGKFAKKGTSITQSITDTTAILKQGLDLTTDTIQSLIKDPEFRRRVGLATGLPMAKLISNLAAQARLNPKLIEKLDEWIASATKEFADQYGDDKNPMAQAIRNSNLAQPPKDASFNEKMEFRVAQYAAYKEALENPEDFSISKRDELIGKAASAAIPIGISLAIALGFEVAIPLFMAQGLNWGTILSSVAIGEAADFAVQKGLDKLEINNPAIRIGASMVAGALAGGLVTGIGNNIKKAPETTLPKMVYKKTINWVENEREKMQKKIAEEINQEVEEKMVKIREDIAKEDETGIQKMYKEMSEKVDQQAIKAFADRVGVNWEDVQAIITSLKDKGIINRDSVTQDESGDLILGEITKFRGFHELPKILSEKEINSLLKTDQYIELYRGIKGFAEISYETMVENFQKGVFYQGNGIYGGGTYTAVSYGTEESIQAALKTAKYYAKGKLNNGHSGAIMRMLINKNAKGIDYDELEKIIDSILDDKHLFETSNNDLNWMLKRMVVDPGYFASLLGYDFYTVKASYSNRLTDFITVLNRGIVTVQDQISIVSPI